VKPTIISKKASNWVDRGEPPNPTLQRVLEFFFERHAPSDEPWLEEHANIVLAEVTDLECRISHDADRHE
jgi:hypothetical protein